MAAGPARAGSPTPGRGSAPPGADPPPGLPSTSWRLVAELPNGELVGELRAHERSLDLALGYDLGGQREIVLDGVLVAAEHRWLGIGRRLLGALADEMRRAGVVEARAVAEWGSGFLYACGWEQEASRPIAFRLALPKDQLSAVPGRPR
ncbi:GNAT family N-acetyltransferase [Micromonospora sp. PLK6-60]|uniref:GNAT family N-acetyltransferase n=1 Tax=Micromonospora sp. PLK6-60 TaxID=2873383 RepID=UPI001CA6A700|nr:GNAT family N-acetyltransferase [Micromonospora sp. PLK6-60]MBY8871778.1 GNAT family N-acetyltransferase [Micromonospora sp. PLK6-60]